MKSFSNIFYGHITDLARPTGDPERSALVLVGDDDAAKATVARLIDDIGFDPYDGGRLAEGRRFQPGTPAYGINAYDISVYPPGPGHPVSAGDLARALAADPS